MKIKIDIDEKLLAKAQGFSDDKDINTVVNEALQLYVTIKSQSRLKDFWGTITVDEQAYGEVK